MAAAIGTLTKAGVKAPQAVTALNQAILSMVAPTDDAIAAAQGLGIEWNATGLATQGFASLIGELNEKAGDNVVMLERISGSVESFKGVSVLAGQGAGEFTRQLDSMGTVTGSTDEAFGKIKQDIELGVSEKGFHQVFMGLEEGDRIVVLGQQQLKDGAQVQVVTNQ